MFRIFGPPGTGKTTRLLNMVEDALHKGIPPNRIAFLAFTRKAANEAKERAALRFELSFDELPFSELYTALRTALSPFKDKTLCRRNTLMTFVSQDRDCAERN